MDLTKRRMPVTFSLPQSLLIRLDTVSEFSEGSICRSRWVEEVLKARLDKSPQKQLRSN